MHGAGRAGRRRPTHSLMVLLLPLVFAGTAARAAPGPQRGPGAPTPVVGLASGRQLQLFPAGQLYPAYIADPHQTGLAIEWQHYTQTDIPATGSSRIGARIGGRLGLVRVSPAGVEDVGWQLSLDVGIDAQFDNKYDQDNIGWDGNYGLLWTGRWHSPWSFRLGLLHTSSHLGDEYLERTGVQRIGYTREEIVAGTRWAPAPRWSLYAEAGWAARVGNANLQERWRTEAGVEFEHPGAFWQGRLGWYAATDLSAMQERNWRLDRSVQVGVVVHSAGRPWRVGISYYDGRPTLGEFFQATERSLTLGGWTEF